ncbi:hypothetical protein C2G38_2146458 [Gigaspora rosea]|uniref:Nudix hydrolase domain-containing protein n=1 Tax=Gigaspora rosea TaxID=44941 RepID=A0A397UH70_9GLOM|nr:hypothetical protein C2G38_2146458 [Gigaspora rosea]
MQMSYNSQSESTSNYRPQYFSHLAITRRIKLKLKYIRPEYLFEQYYLFFVKPEDLGETKYIKKNKRKESIEDLYKNLEKLKSDLKAKLFELALRYESKNNETLNIHNCYENEEYWEIVDTIRRINLTIEYQEQTYSPYYQAQPEKEKQERLQSSYIKFLKELYEKQVGIWISNQYVIAETYKELEKYHEREYEIISYLPERKMTQLILFTEIENETCILLAQRINSNKDFYLKLNGPERKAIHEKNENIDIYVIRECFEEAEIVLRNEKLLKIFEETCYSTKEWRAKPCLQKEAKYIVTLAIYLHPLEEPPKHTEPHTLGPWNLYKIKDLLKHRNELVPILRENIELIDRKIKAYEQDILDLPINAQKFRRNKNKNGKTTTTDSRNF